MDSTVLAANRESEMIESHLPTLIAKWDRADPFADVICELAYGYEVSPEDDRALRLYAVSCVRQVQDRISDARLTTTLDVAERFANGHATADELAKARSAAEAACISALHASNNGRPGASAEACAAQAVLACTDKAAARAAAWALVGVCNALMYGDENYGGPEFHKRVRAGQWERIEAPFRERFLNQFSA